MTISAIETVLVPGCLALASNSRNSGVTVNKGGYHSTRTWLRANKPNDYSIQESRDHLGPSDKGSAFDWSFDDARLHSDFKTIAKFSKRLYEAGQNKDPRTYPLREFQGNIDSDRTVEGWSFFRGHALTTSDLTHLWHIHFSIWRKYISDATAMRSILSILSGEEDDVVSDQDIEKIARLAAKYVWDADVIPAPDELKTADNPRWTAKGSVGFGLDKLVAIDKTVNPETPVAHQLDSEGPE